MNKLQYSIELQQIVTYHFTKALIQIAKNSVNINIFYLDKVSYKFECI